ncbi:MAG: Hsp33 family molecular chaperone HslO [Pseudomonadota bacterium]|nr:Hsp33 family molecular chaperone HslO [Pseudomonadota bacterium]
MDIIKSFMLENGLFKGSFIAADKTVADIWNKHQYPDVLRPIFADAVLVALALSAGIKYQGVFSLQIKGDGPISLLYIDITTDKKVRGYMTVRDDADLSDKKTLSDLFGRGQLIFSVAGLGQEPYQGVVALTQKTLTETVKDYFRLSEQIETDLVLSHHREEGRCILIQRMPNMAGVSSDQATDLWETVSVLLNSVRPQELFSDLSPDEILFRLFHANQLTVFEPTTPIFECRCYRGKMENFLKKMPQQERITLYNGDATIDVSCQFCGEKYTFTAQDLGDADIINHQMPKGIA